MIFTKRLYILFLTLALLLGIAVSLGGCGTETLTVNGGVLESLQAAEPDIDWMRSFYYADDSIGYNGPRYVLHERDGMLYLEEFNEFDDNVHFMYVNSQYLVGADCGEYDGWVLLSDCAGFYPDGDGRFEKILQENCMGFLQKPTGIGEPEVAYIFTGMSMMNDIGTVYRFENESSADWSLKKIADLGSHPYAFLYDKDCIIIATDKSLISVNPDTGEIETLCEPEFWEYLSPNSIIKIGGSYFIGANMGIVEYRIESKSTVWYPYPNIK